MTFSILPWTAFMLGAQTRNKYVINKKGQFNSHWFGKSDRFWNRPISTISNRLDTIGNYSISISTYSTRIQSKARLCTKVAMRKDLAIDEVSFQIHYFVVFAFSCFFLENVPWGETVCIKRFLLPFENRSMTTTTNRKWMITGRLKLDEEKIEPNKKTSNSTFVG